MRARNQALAIMDETMPRGDEDYSDECLVEIKTTASKNEEMDVEFVDDGAVDNEEVRESNILPYFDAFHIFFSRLTNIS